MRDVLARRDIAVVFRFLNRRGFSRAAIAALTGLSETRVRQIWNNQQRISTYEVLVRIAEGLRIPRGYLGLGLDSSSDPAHQGPAGFDPPGEATQTTIGDADGMGQDPRPLTPYASLRHFFGAELRTWRERRGLSQTSLGRRVSYSGAEIGKIEKAERWPSEDLATRCDQALDTGGVLRRLWPLAEAERRCASNAGGVRGQDADSWGEIFHPGLGGAIIGWGLPGMGVRSSPPPLVPPNAFGNGEDVLDPMDRRAFLMSGGALAAGVDGRLWPGLLDGGSRTGRVALADVVEVERATEAVASWDLAHGGRLAAEQGTALLRWSLALMSDGLAEEVRIRLCAAAGYLADRVGWAMFDCGRHDAARAMFHRGLRLAEAAGDINLRTQLLCDAASQRVFCGEADQALTLVETVETGQAGPVPALVTAVHGVRAEAHAALGHDQQVWDCIRRAEDAATLPTRAPTPWWLNAFRDQAGMYASTGYAAFLLSRVSERPEAGRQALDRLSAATAALPGGRVRAKLFGTARLAATHLTHPDGDVSTAVTLTGQVLAGVADLRSARLARELRTLRVACARHERNGEVRSAGREIERLLDQAA
jgi:transcriptional regulator with XRE-family HTH domain